ncbi:hypothetical protein CSV69_12685 [Sporosarcina sp. P26b]|nr:hypothetical protein CSV69_12685 [Sporosarcina sp. P26b]
MESSLGFPLQLGDAFRGSNLEPLPSLRSVQGLKITLIPQESPPASVPILRIKWMDVSRTL